jgi:organic hydroperoxide reductase OsmC/OhrA
MEAPTKVSHTFSVSIKKESTLGGGILSSGKRSPFVVASPPEFGGTDTDWSPEHLLAASIASCYSNTFFYFAKLLKIKVHSLNVDAEMEVEKEDKGPFTATRFILHPEIKLAEPSSKETIDALLEKTKKYCIISNSVKGEIIVQPNIN